jgi:hypothetical protein
MKKIFTKILDIIETFIIWFFKLAMVLIIASVVLLIVGTYYV